MSAKFFKEEKPKMAKIENLSYIKIVTFVAITVLVAKMTGNMWWLIPYCFTCYVISDELEYLRGQKNGV